MKKKIAFLSFTLIVIITLTVVIIINNPKKKSTDIYLCSSYDTSKTSYICEVPSKDVSYSYATKENITAIIKEDIYSTMIETIFNEQNVLYYNEFINAGTLFINNDYYLLLKRNNVCYITLLATEIIYDEYDFYLPINMIEHYSRDSSYDFSKYFDNYTFDSACSFYNKYKEHVSIDSEKNYIYIECCNKYSNKLINIMINFNDKTINILKDKNYEKLM